MTTIAYRDGTMACDSCWQANHVQTTSMTKIVRLASGALFGSSGDGDIRTLQVLLDRVKDFGKMPSRAELSALKCEVDGILVLPHGHIMMISIAPGGADHNNFDHFDAQIWPANRGLAAVGSGAELALGAMAAGKNARSAVAIACRFDIHSRLPVHVMNIKTR